MTAPVKDILLLATCVSLLAVVLNSQLPCPIYAIWAPALAGFITAQVVGSLAVPRVLKAVENRIEDEVYGGDLPAPTYYDQALWKRELWERTPGGEWVGFIECTIIFAAFITNSWLLGGSWLGFKLASKWKSWTTTVELMSYEGQPLQDIRAGLARAALDHRTFIVGTGGNIVAALLGYLVARLLGLEQPLHL